MANILKFVNLLIILQTFEGQIFGQQVASTGRSPIQLGNYRVNRNFITLSGFSSGGTFAQTLHFSYSSLFHGIAVFSHTFYRCGPVTTSQEVYDNACTTLGNNSQPYDFNNVFRDINDYASRGLIEDTRNLRNKRLYIYVGTSNWLFAPEMSLRIQDVFRPFIFNQNEIRTVVQDANATLPTNRLDFPPCSAPPNSIALSNCGLSGALDALKFLVGPYAVQPPSPNLILEPLLTFDQTPFFYGFGAETRRHDMDTVGYLYIPRTCRDQNVECLLHFYFHGCNVGREFVGSAHVQNSGFLEVAEMNSIIMVFPQALSSPENDIGCWDTYGFTGPLYATQRGAQVTVVRNMLSTILGEVRSQKRVTPVSNFKRYGQSLQSGTPIGSPTLGSHSDFVSRYLQPLKGIFSFLENMRNF